MNIIKQSVSLENLPFYQEEIIRFIETTARTCYKSEKAGINLETAKVLLKKIFKKGHLSVFEHFSITGRFITNRGVTHELVRHRIAAYSQESTRFCNYSKNKFGSEITVILPVDFNEAYEHVENSDSGSYEAWCAAMTSAEDYYNDLIARGNKPQIARGVLPIDLKTEIVVTMNIREWWHVFNLRRNPAAHPQMVDLMNQWWTLLNKKMPFFFGEIQG